MLSRLFPLDDVFLIPAIRDAIDMYGDDAPDPPFSDGADSKKTPDSTV